MNKHIGVSATTILILLLGSVVSSYAQFSGNIDVSFTPEQEELNVGDPVKILLEVSHPVGYVVAIPALSEVWGDFEVRAQSNIETIDDSSGMQTTRQTVEVTLFSPGTFQTPTWSIAIKDPNGGITERAVPQASLTVVPVLTDFDRELRDIKPQVDLPLPPVWPWVLLGLLTGLFLILLFYWIYSRLKGRFNKKVGLEELSPELFIDPRPAHVIAYEELECIEQLDLPGQGRFKEYYTLVTDCLRQYIERMYQVTAMDYTTSEIKAALEDTSIDPEHSQQFVTLFASSDYVKFARLIPKTGEARHLISEARHLVDITKYDGAIVTDEYEPAVEVVG